MGRTPFAEIITHALPAAKDISSPWWNSETSVETATTKQF